MDNEGNQFPNNIGLKIDQNTYIFGKNTGDWLKMVAYDMSVVSQPLRVESRYSGPKNSAPQTVTKEVWENANIGGDYTINNMNEFCVSSGIYVNYRIQIYLNLQNL